MSSSPSDYALTPANTRTPSRPGDNRNSSTSHTRSEVIEESAIPVASASMQDLRHQISLLSSEIDAFSAERDAVKEMLAGARTQVSCFINHHMYFTLNGNTGASRGDTRATCNSGQCGSDGAPSRPAFKPRILRQVRIVQTLPCVYCPPHIGARRERQALREEFDQLARQTARREREMQVEIDTLRKALATARAQQREPADDDETRCAPGDPKVLVVPLLVPPSTHAMQSPHIPSAPLVPSPIQHPDAVPNVLEAQIIDNAGGDDDNEGRGHDPEAPEAEPEDDLGSEMDEQSMERATPVHPTILTIADDDLIIPP